MKRIMMTLVAVLVMVSQASAMSYEQARREAFFLTDKMAYELNLTQEQYDAAYEINLDYLMGVTTVDDVYSDYWTRRNLDMSYVLLDWQWSTFCAASYFYRPLYWDAGCWHFGVYARYPQRSFFYFSRPAVYVSYRGGHSWRSNGGRSYYHGYRDTFRNQDNRIGMRDRWNRGDFRGERSGERNSSTRITVNRNNQGNGNGYRGDNNRSNVKFSELRGNYSDRQNSGIRVSGSTIGRTNGTQVGTGTQKTTGESTVRTNGNLRFGNARTIDNQRNSTLSTQRNNTLNSQRNSTLNTQRNSTLNTQRSTLNTQRSTFGASRLGVGTSGSNATSSFRSNVSTQRVNMGTPSRGASFGSSNSGASSMRMNSGASRVGGGGGGAGSHGITLGGRR